MFYYLILTRLYVLFYYVFLRYIIYNLYLNINIQSIYFFSESSSPDVLKQVQVYVSPSITFLWLFLFRMQSFFPFLNHCRLHDALGVRGDHWVEARALALDTWMEKIIVIFLVGVRGPWRSLDRRCGPVTLEIDVVNWSYGKCFMRFRIYVLTKLILFAVEFEWPNHRAIKNTCSNLHKHNLSKHLEMNLVHLQSII